MIDIENIKRQAELSRKAMEQLNEQNNIFGNQIDFVLKNAPEEDKKEIHKLKALHENVQSLVKSGKLEEAQQLIKNFGNGKSN